MGTTRMEAATMVWGWKVGRLGYCGFLNRERLTLVHAGCYYEIWKPLGLGLYWRHSKYLKIIRR